MSEPGNETAWVDRFGDVWVRADDVPGVHGCWWPIQPGLDRVGPSRSWTDLDGVAGYGPFTAASAEQTAAALDRVRREVAT